MATVPVSLYQDEDFEPFVSVDVYLRTSYSPDCDYVDGEVQERNMGEMQHAFIQKFFILLFGQNEKAWGVRVSPENRMKVTETRYRVPDVVVLRRETKFERVIKTPPLICIEVLSSEDRMSRIQEKVEDYIGMGVLAVWVIDPRRRTVVVADRSITLRPAGETLTLSGTDVRIPVADIFVELDELLAE